jgi:hypothetical protein
MNEEITTTTSSSVSAYAEMTKDALTDAIRKEACKARTKGNEMVDCMERIGHLLIELKTRVDYGNFMDQAERMTGLPQRSINRYMAIARDPDGFRNRRRGIPAEEVITLTKRAPTWFDRIERETKVDTVSIPSAVEPPSPPPSRSAVIDVEAAFVARSQKVETPDEMFQRGLRSLQESMPPAEYQAMLERALEGPATAPAQIELETTVETEVDEPPAAPVRLKTMSPASPSQSAAILVLEIYKLLPKMSEGDLKGASASLTELVGVIESRWMKTTSTAPATLSEAWSKTSPEDRAAFLETAHLIEKP